METLCKIRDIYRSIYEFEHQFEKEYNLSLNEGMLLCSLLNEGLLSSGQIADALALSASNTSKIIKSVEIKGLIQRVLGQNDKRQMYFSLTPNGKATIQKIKATKLEIPKILATIISA
ncbi:MAG: MarR family transcriptional regulator [Muribaculaceae bacterium]